MSWFLDGRPLKRVLVARLRYLGDVVMSTVVADLLKAGDPTLQVDFLCEAAHGPVLADHPSLDHVHLLSTKRSGADARARINGGAATAGRGSLSMILELRRRGYDLAVDLFFNPRSAWLLRLVDMPERIGGTRGSRRHLYTRSVHPPVAPDLRDVLAARTPGGLGDHASRLAPLVHGPGGTPFLTWLAGLSGDGPLVPHLPRRRPSAFALEDLAKLGVSGRYLAVAPAATWPSKEWPAAHWRTLLADLPTLIGCPVVVIVPPGRSPDWVPSGPVNDLAVLPPAPLDRVLEYLGGAEGLLTVDGGVMHAAVAMGVPTLALFGPTDPGIWFPYASCGPFRVLATLPDCHPCDLLDCKQFVCLPELGPPIVAEALLELLTPRPGWEPGGSTPCFRTDQPDMI